MLKGCLGCLGIIVFCLVCWAIAGPIIWAVIKGFIELCKAHGDVVAICCLVVAGVLVLFGRK